MTFCRLIAQIFWCLLLCIGIASCNTFDGEEKADPMDPLTDEVYVQAENNEGKWPILIGLGLSFIGIIAAFTSLKKISSLKREILNLEENSARQRDDIYQLPNGLITRSNQRSGRENTQQVSYVEFSRLVRRVSELEQKASLNNQRESVQYVSESCCNQDQRSVSQRSGYFGSPIEGEEGHGYFRRLLESPDGARFKVTVEQNNAEFLPIVQPGELASSDALDLAVEYEGNVNKSDNPRDMQIKQNGRAVKNGDKWIIINKAIVILHR